jgi:hypothetical protein
MHSHTLRRSNLKLSRCRSHGDMWLSRSGLPWQRQSSHQVKVKVKVKVNMDKIYEQRWRPGHRDEAPFA